MEAIFCKKKKVTSQWISIRSKRYKNYFIPLELRNSFALSRRNRF